jgi:hypothetical protein
VLRPLSAVAARPVEWLWPGWIPLGKLTVLDGDPGLGKSSLLLDLAARLSRGAPMPDGSTGPEGESLILSAEDDGADTIRPRLDAAGAEAGRVHLLTHVRDRRGARPLEIPGDLPALDVAARRHEARLVIIDPLMSYLSGVDAARDQDVRRALYRLARLAARRRCAVVCLRHLSKMGGDKAIYRGGGSIGIIGSARAGLLVAADPDSERHRLLAVTKANLAERPASLRFTMEPAGPRGVCRVVWCGRSEYSADGLVGRMSPYRAEKLAEARSELAEAEMFLREFLSDGPLSPDTIFLMGTGQGFSRRTVERAAQRIGVIRNAPNGFRGKGYTWELPPDAGRPPRKGRR